jgi:DNA invertase Pin-like site-specific DNA recombinase
MAAVDERRAVAYVRVSTAEQHNGPEAQRQSIEQWGRARGVEIVACHVDAGVSGAADLADRPALLAALDDLEQHRAALLVVAKRDRLARDVLKAGAIEAATVARGARVVSADGVADGDDPAAKMLRSMLDVFAAFEREMIRARTRAALAAKKARGEVTGQPRLGTELAPDGRTLVPNAMEQRAICRAGELRAAGLTLRAIGAQLESEAILSRAGRRYGPRSVAILLERSEA